ncbi:MAG: hypothetical protein AB7E81_15675 [Hyphomicrobiaceae bacterium]
MTAIRKPSAGTGILSVWNEYPADQAAFYERWYMTEHFPERLGVPGFLRGRRYRAVEADRTYFTFYELDSPEVLFSGAYIARLNDPTAWTRRIMGHWSSMFRTACRRVARVGDAVGGYVAAARFEEPVAVSRGQALELKERLADPCVVAVDIWQATAEQNAETKEASARSEADLWISGAVIVETTNEASAQRAKAMLPELLGIAPASASIGIYALIALQDAPAG